jgi:hypothetical protein
VSLVYSLRYVYLFNDTDDDCFVFEHGLEAAHFYEFCVWDFVSKLWVLVNLAF